MPSADPTDPDALGDALHLWQALGELVSLAVQNAIVRAMRGGR